MHLNFVIPASKPQTAPKRKPFLAQRVAVRIRRFNLLADELAIPSPAAKILSG